MKVIYLPAAHHDPRWRDSFEDVFRGKHDLRIYDSALSLEPQFSEVEVVVDMGGDGTTLPMVDAARQVRLWQILTVGYDLFIDRLVYLKSKQIPVVHCPGSTSSPGLAECAIMFMIQISKRYNEAQRVMKSGGMYEPMGQELAGRILGLIGFGASGRALARLAKVLGMRFMIIEPMPIAQNDLDELDPLVVAGPDQMEKVFREADFVSLHLPLTDETKGIVNRNLIGLMKPTSALINVARGDIVDQEALYQALLENRIAGIGTDVHAGRKPDFNHPVYDHPNFYALPHVAGTTTETPRRRAEIALENVDCLAAGLARRYRIDTVGSS